MKLVRGGSVKLVYGDVSEDLMEDIKYVIGCMRDGYNIYEFDEYDMGSSGIVYRYEDLIIKIGVDIGGYLASGKLKDHLVSLPDGYLLESLKGIVRVPDVYVYNDYVVVMEYIRGTYIRELVGERKRLAYDELVDTYMRALSHGYLLKDLNDSNVLYDDNGICLLDLGNVIRLSDDEKEKYMEMSREDVVSFFEMVRY